MMEDCICVTPHTPTKCILTSHSDLLVFSRTNRVGPDVTMMLFLICKLISCQDFIHSHPTAPFKQTFWTTKGEKRIGLYKPDAGHCPDHCWHAKAVYCTFNSCGWGLVPQDSEFLDGFLNFVMFMFQSYVLKFIFLCDLLQSFLLRRGELLDCTVCLEKYLSYLILKS